MTFDAFVSDVAVAAYHRENLTVPTRILHAAADSLAPDQTAAMVAPRIRGARCVTIEKGPHLFLGHHEEVGDAVNDFIPRAAQSDAVRLRTAGANNRAA